MLRRHFLKENIFTLGTFLLGPLTLIANPASNYYFSLTHQFSDSDSYSKNVDRWINAKKFMQITDEFRNFGLLTDFKVIRLERAIRYEWIFRNRESQILYESLIRRSRVFTEKAFEEIDVISKRQIKQIA